MIFFQDFSMIASLDIGQVSSAITHNILKCSFRIIKWIYALVLKNAS